MSTSPAELVRRVPGWVRGAVIALLLYPFWMFLNGTLKHGAPPEIILNGVISGSLYALVAIGIVLIYRANKVINFAQAEFGSVAAVLAIEFVKQWHWNYFLAIGAGLVIALVVGGFVEVAIIRRFRNAPRLILAVATIGLAQVLNGIAILIGIEWSGMSSGGFNTPFGWHFKLGAKVFYGDHILVLIVVPIVLALLASFLRFTDYGVAIRAAAENGDRANLLGVPVQRLSTMVWAIAGFLSASAVILHVPLVGFSSMESVSGGGFTLLLYTLTAAVLGAMSSLPMTFLAAIGLGIMQELGAWTFQNSSYVDAALLVIILLSLLLRRDKFNRAMETGIGTFRALREVRPIPTELRDQPAIRLARRVMKLALVAFAVGLPLIMSPSRIQLSALILIYSIVAISLVVLTGWSGHISLGHWAFVGIGAATTGILLTRHGWDLFLAVPAGILVSAAAAFLVGLPALRISGPFLAVTTLAFAVTSGSYFLVSRFFPWFIPDAVPRPVLWNRLQIDTDWKMYYVCLVGLVITLAAAQGLRRSRTGRTLIAIRDNRLNAQALGVDTTRLSLVGFALSGAMAGLAGALYVLHQHGFKSDAFGPEVSLRLFSMVVIGGLGSLPGAILGATYIRGAEFFLPHGWSQIASGGGIMLLLLLLPGGLGELVYTVRDDLLRRYAKAKNIYVPSLLADVRQEEEEAPVALDAALGGLIATHVAEAAPPSEPVLTGSAD
jgi:branched-chain amino acid transport system permease protein